MAVKKVAGASYGRVDACKKTEKNDMYMFTASSRRLVL